MQLRQFEFGNKDGLTTTHAALFVRLAGSFSSQIHVEKGNKKINAKSLMGVLSLGVKQNDTLLIFVDGDDEQKAITAIEKLFEANFEL